MNIVYSSSDSYAPIMGVSLYSLLKNNTDSHELNIFIIDNNIKLITTKFFISIHDVLNDRKITNWNKWFRQNLSKRF